MTNVYDFNADAASDEDDDSTIGLCTVPALGGGACGGAIMVHGTSEPVAGTTTEPGIWVTRRVGSIASCAVCGLVYNPDAERFKN